MNLKYLVALGVFLVLSVIPLTLFKAHTVNLRFTY